VDYDIADSAGSDDKDLVHDWERVEVPVCGPARENIRRLRVANEI
jgi:hypothetical protein